MEIDGIKVERVRRASVFWGRQWKDFDQLQAKFKFWKARDYNDKRVNVNECGVYKDTVNERGRTSVGQSSGRKDKKNTHTENEKRGFRERSRRPWLPTALYPQIAHLIPRRGLSGSSREVTASCHERRNLACEANFALQLPKRCLERFDQGLDLVQMSVFGR